MPNGGKTTVTTVGSTVWTSTTGCAAIVVRCQAASSNGAFVQIVGIHDTAISTDGYTLEVGESMIFRKGYSGITGINVFGVGGNANIAWSVVSLQPLTSAKVIPIGTSGS